MDIPGPTSRGWGEVLRRRLGIAAWTQLANGEGNCLLLCGLDEDKKKKASPGASLAQPTSGLQREGVVGDQWAPRPMEGKAKGKERELEIEGWGSEEEERHKVVRGRGAPPPM